MARRDADLAIEDAIQHVEQGAETLEEVNKLTPLKSGLRNMSMLVREIDGQEENHPEAARWFREARDIANKTQNAVDSLVDHHKLQKQKSKFERFLSGGKRRIKQSIEEIEVIEVRIADHSDYPDPGDKEKFLRFFSALPADFDVPAKRMIRMWAAERGLNRIHGRREAEIGEEYLKELVNGGFIQAGGTEIGDGHAKTCRMSDHVSYLCISNGEVQKFLRDQTDNTPIKEDTKWLGIHADSFMHILNRVERHLLVTSLHSFVENNKPISIRAAPLWTALHQKFPNVRVLNLDSLELEMVPKDLGKLKCLRYLRLRAPNAMYLPSSVCRLAYLETLDMRESLFCSMPREIWKMERLRHLYLGRFTMPDAHSIDYYKTLSNLQTLSKVQPDKALKRLMVKAKFPNVTKLRIISTSDTTVASKFLNSIDHLYHLQSLRIENPVELPDLNAFPLSLTKLTLLKTILKPECIKTLERLPNLRTLKLLESSISGKEIECNVGGFPQLEVLSLKNLAIAKWVEGTMRCLKHLSTDNPSNIPSELRQRVKVHEMEATQPDERQQQSEASLLSRTCLSFSSQ